MLTLSPSELRELTGYKQAGKQREWLDVQGVPYRDDGRILVSRTAAEQWLSGVQMTPSRAPDLSAVPRAGLNAGLAAWQAQRREVLAEVAARAEADRPRHEAWIKARREGAPARRRASNNARTSVRRATRVQRTPTWADLAAIAAIYAEAQRLTAATGVQHHVDHEYPLRGKRVSGLHVAGNLRVLPAVDNLRKYNRFEPC